MRRYAQLAVFLLLLGSAGKSAFSTPQIAVQELTGPDTKSCTQVTLAMRGLIESNAADRGTKPAQGQYRLEGVCMEVEKHLLINVHVVDRTGATISGTSESMLCDVEEMTVVLERLTARLMAAVSSHERSVRLADRTTVGNAYRSTRSAGKGNGSVAAGASAAAAARRAATMQPHKSPQ